MKEFENYDDWKTTPIDDRDPTDEEIEEYENMKYEKELLSEAFELAFGDHPDYEKLEPKLQNALDNYLEIKYGDKTP